jgi:DNA repair protein RadC
LPDSAARKSVDCHERTRGKALAVGAGMLPDAPEERPRERLLAWGGDRISDADLIAILLGTGQRGQSAPDLAAALLRTAGGLGALARASPRELATVSGIGDARAARVCAAFHLGRRAVEQVAVRAAAVMSADDVFRRLRPRIAGLDQEVCVVLGLDSRNAVLDEVEIARGTLTGVDVHPREVFRPLIRMAAAAAVVVHNHPSGAVDPSDADLELTRRLRAAGDVIGIPIVDHVIVADTGYRSLAEYLGADF